MIFLGKTLAARGIQVDVCNKFIIHLTKVLIGVLEIHPFCYVELIPTSLEFSVFYCFTEAGQALAFERFIIQCLNLVKCILLSTFYRPAKVEGLFMVFFTFLFDLCDIIRINNEMNLQSKQRLKMR